MITIADIPVNVPDLEISNWLANNIDPERATYWTTRAFPGFGMVGITIPTGFRVPKRIRLNSFNWPRGAARWAYGFFLCDSQLLGPIQDAAFGSDGTRQNLVTLKMNTVSTVPSPGDETLTTSVYLLPPTPLSYLTPPNGPSVNNLWLLTVVDVRYYWWNYSWPLTQIGPGGVSWTSLFTKASTTLASTIQGGTITVDTISSNYLNASSSFNLSHEPIPLILDALAYNVGQRLVRKYDGSVITQNFSTAYTAWLADQANYPYRAVRAGGNRFVSIL